MKALRLLILALALPLAACGDDDGGATPTGAGGDGTGGLPAGGGGQGAEGGMGGEGGQVEGPTPEQILSTPWQLLDAAPSINGKQDDLYFLSPELGYSVNGLGRIYKTVDGGASWTQLVDQPGTYFRAILFVDEQRGFAGNIGPDYFPGVTDDTPLYGTTDGGATWAPVAIEGPAVKGICNFTKSSDEHIVGVGRVGGPAFLIKSSDAGATWTSLDLNDDIAMLIDARFTTPEKGIIVGGDALSPAGSHTVILSTEDGGATWSERYRSTQTGELAWKISFPSEEVGYVSVLRQGTGAVVLKTTDGGETWARLPLTVAPYAAKGIGFITEDIGWVGGEGPSLPVYRTADGGATWQEDASLGPYLNRFRFVDPWTAYAIGQSIHKLSIPHP